MIITCEMLVNDFFKLSVGHIAFVGKIVPDMDKFIPTSKADLYIGEKKLKLLIYWEKIDFPGGMRKKERG